MKLDQVRGVEQTISRRVGIPKKHAAVSTSQASALTGLSLRQLQWFDEQGIVVPERDGRNRVYHSKHMQELAFVSHALEKGFSLQRVRGLLNYARRAPGCAYLMVLSTGVEGFSDLREVGRAAVEHLGEVAVLPNYLHYYATKVTRNVMRLRRGGERIIMPVIDFPCYVRHLQRAWEVLNHEQAQGDRTDLDTVLALKAELEAVTAEERDRLRVAIREHRDAKGD